MYSYLLQYVLVHINFQTGSGLGVSGSCSVKMCKNFLEGLPLGLLTIHKFCLQNLLKTVKS